MDYGWTSQIIKNVQQTALRSDWLSIFKCLTEGIWSLIGDVVLALSNSWLQNGQPYFQGPFLLLKYKIVK